MSYKSYELILIVTLLNFPFISQKYYIVIKTFSNMSNHKITKLICVEYKVGAWYKL